MFNFRLYEADDLYGLTYQFPKRGDGIGMHSHHESQKHNCIVLKGSVEIYGPEKIWSITLHKGEMSFARLPEPHEVAALEDDTEILGLFVNGRPEGEYVPEDQKTGTVTSKPLTIALTNK